MATDRAELSSIQSSLEQLASRVAAIAAAHDQDPDDHIAPALFEVDRSLRGALRQLARLHRDL